MAALVLVAGALTPAHAGGIPAAPVHAPGRSWRVFLGSPIVSKPAGIAIDLRGKRGAAQWGYVADAGTGRIVKFGTGGRVLGSWRYAPAGHAAALTVGGAGNLFTADRSNGTVSKFSPTGRRLAYWTPAYFAPLNSPPYVDPRSITIDAAGNLYLAEYSAHRILQLSPAGTLLRTWDTSLGFTALYSVPHMNSGPLGSPTGVVFAAPDHLFISTVCVDTPPCPAERFTPGLGSGHDALLVLFTRGANAGYVGNFWFGLAYAATGTPVEPPGKESEVFVHIDAMAGDGKGHSYLAGTLWPRGGQPVQGVTAYSDIGYHPNLWPLPGAAPVTGVAVDGSGALYVSQGNVLLKRAR